MFNWFSYSWWCTTLDGSKPEDALLNICNQGADIVGSNCDRAPDTMLQFLKDTINKLDVNTNKIPIGMVFATIAVRSVRC